MAARKTKRKQSVPRPRADGGSRIRKPIVAIINELKSWLPNYDHGPNDYPTILLRTLAALPGGEELEDVGYEPIGGIGWHEADQLGRVLEAIQDKQDVEDIARELLSDNEEELEESGLPPSRGSTGAARPPSVRRPCDTRTRGGRRRARRLPRMARRGETRRDGLPVGMPATPSAV